MEDGVELTWQGCSVPQKSKREDIPRPKDLVGSKVVKLSKSKAQRRMQRRFWWAGKREQVRQKNESLGPLYDLKRNNKRRLSA